MEYVHGGDIYSYGDVLDFSVNLNPFGTGEAVKEAIVQSASGIAGQYPDSRCRGLRRALSEKLGIPQDFLIFGNGAAELIFLLAQVCRPKRAVLTEPSFAEYRQALEAADCEIREYVLQEKNGFLLDEKYLEMLDEDVDLIFLCSPDNPTGNVISRKLLLEILRRCEKKKIRMVLDECFLDFLLEPKLQTLQEELAYSGQLFILRAFTKMYAMPGVRLGYGMCSDRALLEKMERSRQPWSVSGIAQAAGTAALTEDGIAGMTRQFVAKERSWLERELDRIGVTYFPSQVNYLLLKSPYPLFEKLLKRKILIRDCSSYRGLGQGYYRIAVRMRKENECLLQALEEIYEKER